MKRRIVLIALALCALSGAGFAAAQESLPARAELAEGWNWLAPGGETACSDGSPYRFVAREGPGEDLLIYFEGGGACWSPLTCGLVRPFTPAIETERLETAADGIFDLDNPANPFAGYDIVLVPYCTADVFMGDAVQDYGSGSRAVTIHHKGFANASAALEWVYANFPAPESVFITGESAGALGASFHAPWIIRQYAGTRIAVLGDSAGGYSAPGIDMGMIFGPWGTADLLPDWLPEFAAVDEASDLKFESFYIVAAKNYPEIVFAQYNTLRDSVQQFFMKLVPNTPPLEAVLPGTMAAIAEAAPNFRSYLADGDVHTILHLPEFYTATTAGVAVRDWVAALAAGEPVENVTCEACVAP